MSIINSSALAVALGIESKIPITPEQMADQLNLTIFPYDEDSLSNEVRTFLVEFLEALNRLKVNIVPYEQSLHTVPISKTIKRLFAILANNIAYLYESRIHTATTRVYIDLAVLRNLLIRRRIKPGIAIVAVGTGNGVRLPIDFTSSFTRTLVTTIVDRPKHITKNSTFFEHFDTAMGLFAQYMTNVVIAVDQTSWTLYNFNASHPTFNRNENFDQNLLKAYISKAAAPMRPEKLKAFLIKQETFDIHDSLYKRMIDDFIAGGKKLETIGLFPKGKRIDDLPFKNDYYRWIGRIHLDQRSGMSYGFLAWQLPVTLSELHDLSKAPEVLRQQFAVNDIAEDSYGNLCIALRLPTGEFYMALPDVQVLTLRSGCDKTNLKPSKDLLLMGIKNGRMYLETPKGMHMAKDYRPSFDTKVILAHALGNAIAASILKSVGSSRSFVEQVSSRGMALSHWHGYISQNYIPKGWYVHGAVNPHVACSTPQSAIYAIVGKLNALETALAAGEEFNGDIHIEPHHGTNINFPSLVELADYFSSERDIVSLGNKHFSEQ